MKIKRITIILTIFILLLMCHVSSEANWKYVFANMIYGNNTMNNGNILFSKESGFYDDEFVLRIYAPTNEIYYTLDGSEPDKNSIKYSSGIKITDASNNPNVYSMITDVCAEFDKEIVLKYSEKDMYYKVPDYNIDKCTVLRAAYYDEQGNKSKIEEKIYFVGYDKKSGYDDVNIISIVTEPENLFDSEKGIYVLGNEYVNFQESGEIDEHWAKEYWFWWPANYRNKGIDWERASNIQVFNKNKELVLSQNAGIRIQGGGSRGYLPKSLNVYAREEYGSDRLQYDFWSTGYYPKRMTLTSGGDDVYTKMKDRLVSELSEDCNFVKMNYEPYVLFLNGEYWGFYYLTEKYDVQYIENYYGVDKGTVIDDIIIMKNGVVETGVEADFYVSYKEMREFILENDMSDDANYQQVQEIIDVQSFIDYYAVESYIGRCGDWPKSNIAMWRSRYTSEKPYEDGRWRWMLFDVNSTVFLHTEAIDYARGHSDLFESLWNNENFRKAFSERLIELSETNFSPENVDKKLEEYVALMDAPMEKHFQRFFGTSNEKFHEEVDEIREFFNNRRETILESINNHM